jgi:hypothetical protein
VTMLASLSVAEHRSFLAAKQAQMSRLLCHLLEGLARDDVATFTPIHRAYLVDVIAHVPAEIPADIVAPLRRALPETEVAA